MSDEGACPHALTQKKNESSWAGLGWQVVVVAKHKHHPLCHLGIPSTHPHSVTTPTLQPNNPQCPSSTSSDPLPKVFTSHRQTQPREKQYRLHRVEMRPQRRAPRHYMDICCCFCCSRRGRHVAMVLPIPGILLLKSSIRAVEYTPLSLYGMGLAFRLQQQTVQ